MQRQVLIRFNSRGGASTAGRPLAPPELRPALVADAREQGSNLKDVILRILSDRHSMRYEATGRRTAPAETGDINVKMPSGLYAQVSYAAALADRTVPRQIIATLCEHYGIADVPDRRATAAA